MVDGGILLRVTAFDTKTSTVKHSLQLAYVSRHVRVPYLSLSACIDLGLVPADFPSVGSCDTPDKMANLCPVTSPMSQPCSNTGVAGPDDAPCQCPRRTLPPTTPTHLPCAPTEENLPILKQYILDRYSSSAFNCCETQLSWTSLHLCVYLLLKMPRQLLCTHLLRYHYTGKKMSRGAWTETANSEY